MLKIISSITCLFFCQALLCVVKAAPLAVFQEAADKELVKTDTLESINNRAVPEKDFIDVLRQWRKKKVDTSRNVKSATPGKILYSIVPAVGYTLSTGFTGIISANAAFYLSDIATTNISSVSSAFNYTQYSQIMVPVLANIWTKNNGFNLVIDWRFFKYPQDTYGLGGHTALVDADKINYKHLRLHQSFLKRVGNSFYAGVGYFMDYRWNIKEHGDNSDVRDYGLTKSSMSSGLVGILSYDNRKNSINPEEGLYSKLEYRPNTTWMGSNTNWQSLTIDVRKYVNFPKGSRNVLAFWNYNWLTLSGKPPYLDLPGTGWDPFNNTGRGYIQGRFRSPNMLYLESEYRFVISRNGLFGGVAFANAQSFSNWQVENSTMSLPLLVLG